MTIKTGLLIVAHQPIASSIVEVAKMILKNVPDCIAVDIDSDQEPLMNVEKIRLARNQLKNERIFLIEDIPYATPSNVARQALNKEDIAIISPLSLHLLLKLINYRDLPLEDLKKKFKEIIVTVE